MSECQHTDSFFIDLHAVSTTDLGEVSLVRCGDCRAIVGVLPKHLMQDIKKLRDDITAIKRSSAPHWKDQA